MSSAAEARFRVQAPNSTPRATLVIALDPSSEHVIRRLAEGRWIHATFFGPPSGEVPGDGSDAWLDDVTGRRASLRDEVIAADQVVMVAAAGGNAQAAKIIGQACSLERVMTTALVVGATGASGPDLARTLAQVRPWSLMVVIAGNDDFIEDMLTALRA